MIIEVCERAHDRIRGNTGQPDRVKYHAQIKRSNGEGSKWGCGISVDAAIGSLIRSYPEDFDINIEFLGILPR